jgi:phosphoglycerate dehydrogenase-like enzyme
VKRHVVVTAPFSDTLIERITSVSPELSVERLSLADGRWPENKSTNAEILYMVSPGLRPEQAPNLRWVQGHWAGVDKLVGTPLWESEVMITNASGVHAPNMAQYALTQLLAWAHRVPRWFQFQREGKWPSRRWETFQPDELHGRTLGILGYGSIGRELARLVQGFNMTILVTKRDAKHTEDTGYNVPGHGDPEGVLPQRIYPAEATRSMLAACDYVVVTLPLTEKTRHLFNEATFREMKSNCFLVNVGRGELINEKDLVRALNKGWIAGAGLDVFETEPLPENSPLWQMENVIITPHVSGMTPHYDERAADLFAANLRRYLGGEPLLNLVKRSEGY